MQKLAQNNAIPQIRANIHYVEKLNSYCVQVLSDIETQPIASYLHDTTLEQGQTYQNRDKK